MIILAHGDIFDSDADVLVNPVNTVGVMGKGLAKVFSIKYPEILLPYIQACKDGTLVVGGSLLTKTYGDKTILNVATKGHWRDNSSIAVVEKATRSILAEMKKNNIRSIAIPLIGAGCGNVPEDQVRELLIKLFMDTRPENIKIELYLYK